MQKGSANIYAVGSCRRPQRPQKRSEHPGVVSRRPGDLKNDRSIAVDPNESVGVKVDLKKPVGLKEASQKFFK